MKKETYYEKGKVTITTDYSRIKIEYMVNQQTLRKALSLMGKVVCPYLRFESKSRSIRNDKQIK